MTPGTQGQGSRRSPIVNTGDYVSQQQYNLLNCVYLKILHGSCVIRVSLTFLHPITTTITTNNNTRVRRKDRDETFFCIIHISVVLDRVL